MTQTKFKFGYRVQFISTLSKRMIFSQSFAGLERDPNRYNSFRLAISLPKSDHTVELVRRFTEHMVIWRGDLIRIRLYKRGRSRAILTAHGFVSGVLCINDNHKAKRMALILDLNLVEKIEIPMTSREEAKNLCQ